VFHWFRPELAGVLFSSWHGLFYWHPVLLPAFAGLVWWTWHSRRSARPSAGSAESTGAPITNLLSPITLAPLVFSASLLAAAAGTIYINAAWWCWWFAAAFGSRAFDGALLGLMAGHGFLLARSEGRVRRVLLWLSTGLVVWNIYVFVLFRTAAISRNEPVTWLEMLTAAPRLFRQLAFE
jgi:hypothetical protein